MKEIDYGAIAAVRAVLAYREKHDPSAPAPEEKEIKVLEDGQEIVVFSREEPPISPWKGLAWTDRKDLNAWRNTTRGKTRPLKG